MRVPRRRVRVRGATRRGGHRGGGARRMARATLRFASRGGRGRRRRLHEDAKDGKHVPLLRALARSFAVNPGLAAGAASLVEPLAPFAKTGASKPSQRVEGAMALYVIARAAAADADAARRAEKEGVWKEALRPDGTYFSPASAAKLGAEDSETMASLAGALMGWHGDRLASAECATAAREMAALMLLHPTPAVRAAARGAMDAAAEGWRFAGGAPGVASAVDRRRGRTRGMARALPEEGDTADLAFPRRLAGAALGAFCGLGGAGRERGAGADAGADARARGRERRRFLPRFARRSRGARGIPRAPRASPPRLRPRRATRRRVGGAARQARRRGRARGCRFASTGASR